MKLSTVLLFAAALSAPLLSTPALAKDDAIVASLCAYVADDNKNDLRRTLSDNRIRLKSVYDGISCNGLSLVRFAMTSKATGAGEFIIKQLPGSHFSQSGDLEWAKSNGLDSSPLFSMIQTRMNGA